MVVCSIRSLSSRSTHDVLTELIRTRKQDMDDIVIPGNALPLPEVSSGAPAQHCKTFDEAKSVISVEINKRKDEVPSLNNTIADRFRHFGK